MIRVLHFYKTSLPTTVGGVEQVIHHIATDTRDLGIETTVLSLSPLRQIERIDYHSYRVHRVPQDFQVASTGFSRAAISEFSRLIHQVDLVHYHFPWPFMDLVHFMCLRKQKPTILTYHSDIVRQKYWIKLYRPLQFQFLSNVDRIVATSPNYLQSSKVLQAFSHKTEVIPIGLNACPFQQLDAQHVAYWRQKLPQRFFLFVGVLRYYKGLHCLLRAARQLDCPIVIAGTGPLENELRTFALENKLKNIHFLGFISDEDKVAILQLSYGLVFPSSLRSEAFGISLLEGAVSGKPLISCEIGTGTSYINVHHETGLVIPPNDEDALAKAMIFLWQNPERAAAMGVAAQKRYQTLFTAEQMAKSYAQLYKDMSKNG